MGCTSTPSVKGIYLVIFMIFTTYSVFSQVEKTSPYQTTDKKWEFGIDAGVIVFKENTTPLFLRYYLTTHQSLRLGLGMNMTHHEGQKERFLYSDSSSIRAYNTIKTNTYQTTIFLGYQIEKELKRFSLYTASDLLFNYGLIKDKVTPDSIITKNFVWADLNFFDDQRNIKVIGGAFCQSIGIKIPIMPRLSLSVESALTVSLSRNVSKVSMVGTFATPTTLGYGDFGHTSEKTWIFEARLAEKLKFLITYHF